MSNVTYTSHESIFIKVDRCAYQDLDESDEKIDMSQNIQSESITNERPSTKTHLSTFKPTLQPDSMNGRQTPLVCHQHSLLEPHSRELSTGQSKESNNCGETHLHGISTAPTTISRPPSSTNQPFQQHGRYQLPMSLVSNNSNSKLQPKESVRRNSVEMADNQSNLCFENIIDSITSTSHDDPNLVKLSQMLKLDGRKLFPAMKKLINSVDEKISHEGIMKNIRTVQHPTNSMRQLGLPDDSTNTQYTQLAQNSIQQELVDDSRMNDVGPQNIRNIPIAQNILMLAEQHRPVFETSREQQNLPTRENYVQQSIRQQDMLRRSTITPILDQKVYQYRAMLSGGTVVQRYPNSINQPIQVLPQNRNQNVPINNVHAQEVKKHELMKISTDRAHIIDKPVVQKEVNIHFATHNSSSQSHQDAENPATKTRPTKLSRSAHNKDTKQPSTQTSIQALLDAQKSSFIQELGLQERVDQSSMTCNNTNLAAISESHQSNHEYQHPRLKKTVVALATETDSMMDVDPSVETTAGSTIGKIASNVVESARQTDESLRKEETSFGKETASDSEHSSEIELENEVVPKANQTILTVAQNLTPENKYVQSRLFMEEDMMDVFSTLFTQMGANLAFARDMFDCLRNSVITCAQTHETLLKNVMKFNSIVPYQISTSSPNNVLSQATQGKSARDNDNATIVGNATTSIREKKVTFSLPAEYDPNDTKWTLKYRENKPGLVELIPQTGVYVKKKELKRCIRESNDCRTLARLLLTEVFSQNALSVCSWTGGKAKAFTSANIDVRPGLDANARMVLLSFIEEHGKKHGWNTSNTLAVMTTIRTKIKDIRDKHEEKFNA
uniref:Conserved hypothetical BEN domain protein n=1 Tax=Cotesia sesamiae Kitale bracovirus TaxID=452648 RepID=S0DH92_9VIRU|nr:conserved hypothetical BEN domain protein [Cotesia sesamiae Kitale bracovirus]